MHVIDTRSGMGILPGIITGLLLFGTLGLVSCKSGSTKGNAILSPGDGGGNRILISLRQSGLQGEEKPAATEIDSIHISISAEDMLPMQFSFTGSELEVELPGIPPGKARLLQAGLYQGGSLHYFGEARLDLSKEEPARITMPCSPRFSHISGFFHLGPGNPYRVAAGKLTLTSDAWKKEELLSLEGEFARFLFEFVPGNKKYRLRLELFDAAGETVLTGEMPERLLESGKLARWELPLSSSHALAVLGFTLQAAAPVLLQPRFPSLRRPPKQYGEVIFTEFYAAPSAADSGSEGEWMEILNRATDTLDLRGCRISREGSVSPTKSLQLDSTLFLEPGRAYVLGRKAAAKADSRFDTFGLVNTQSTLMLLCRSDSLLLDTLHYNTVLADGAPGVRIREGRVSTLRHDRLELRELSENWCHTAMVAREGLPGASPGEAESHCPR